MTAGTIWWPARLLPFFKAVDHSVHGSAGIFPADSDEKPFKLNLMKLSGDT